MNPDQHARYSDQLLTDVDLHLLARRRLESNARDIGRQLVPALVFHRALHRAHARCHATFGELVRNHDRVALGDRREQLPRFRPSVVVEFPCRQPNFIAASSPPRR